MSDKSSRNESSPGRLVAVLLAIALIWGWGLPWWSNRAAMQRQLQFLDQRGIDPSAMFYTELEMMDSILDRLEADRFRR